MGLADGGRLVDGARLGRNGRDVELDLKPDVVLGVGGF